MSKLPLVSIVIPSRNEGDFINSCLDSVIANDFPKDRLEVMVVDGMSGDKTREIVKGYSEKYSFINLLDNPKRITPVAFNIGIKHAKGEVIMIMGSHSTYKKNYISECVKYLEEYDADNVGGIMITLPRDNAFIGKAIVTALSHRFGVGDSAFRTGSKVPKWVDTVFGGCYKKEVFEKVGLFNENLVSTQDMEFNLRLKKDGGKTLLVPDIVSNYYARSSFTSFCKNNFRNGIWVIMPFAFSKIVPVSWRHLVPLVFVTSLIGSMFLSLFFPITLWLFILIFTSYMVINIFFSISIAFREKGLKYLFIMPFIFASLHITYGLGSLWGLLKVIVAKRL